MTHHEITIAGQQHDAFELLLDRQRENLGGDGNIDASLHFALNRRVDVLVRTAAVRVVAHHAHVLDGAHLGANLVRVEHVDEAARPFVALAHRVEPVLVRKLAADFALQELLQKLDINLGAAELQARTTTHRVLTQYCCNGLDRCFRARPPRDTFDTI